MGRHHQQHSRRSGYVAHLALGAATVAGLVSGGGVAVALQAAPAVPVAPVFPTTAPAAVTPVVAPVPATTAAPRTSSAAVKSATSKATSPKKSAPVCDLSGPPEFGDPAHPNVITNRNCGYVDSQGRERSRDRWIDDQLLDAGN